MSLGLHRMVRDLKAWYPQERAANPLDTLYDIGDITVPMIGKPGQRSLALKAAECGTFLVFCSDICRRFHDKLPNGSALAEVGEHLVRMRFLMRTSPEFFSDSAQQEFVDCAIKAFVLRTEAGLSWAPKWHFMLDMAHESCEKGNPQYYSTWVDESYNHELASVARVCHASTWHRRVLVAFRWAVSFIMPVKAALGAA